ncbi:MAG: S8 family serine peptidase [Chloroflexi bacterium]|nr:S8 family serine peptidase [Chloroflexota bacterium]
MIERPPAWGLRVAADLLPLQAIPHLDEITREWAWETSTGQGVKVAVIDSGIDAAHPAVGGRVGGYVAIGEGPDGLTYDTAPHADAFGHGTACAGIIRAVAPECELYSVKVLGPGLSGRGPVFLAGLRWAIEHGMHVCNLSLGTTRKDFFGMLHELADLAYFRNVILVAAANNMPIPSFPSLYASVVSVASHDVKDPYDPYLYYYNPRPPVEFVAPGIGVRVAWLHGQWITTTGNSCAAPHLAGIIARILGKHPGLAPFQVKTILRALAANVAAPRLDGTRGG